MVAAAMMSLLLRWAFARENKRRDLVSSAVTGTAEPVVAANGKTTGSPEGKEISREPGDPDGEAAEHGGIMPPVLPGLEDYRDRTDREIVEFRYSL